MTVKIILSFFFIGLTALSTDHWLVFRHVRRKKTQNELDKASH